MITAKDDAWVLPWVAPRLSASVDGVIALDDGSTDASAEHLAAMPNLVHLFRNPPGQAWDPEHDLDRMMAKVHEVRPDWVLLINSDDLLDARFADQRGALLGRSEVGRYHFREITLWDGMTQHRVDRPEWYHRSRGTTPYLVRYSPQLRLVNSYHKNWRRRLLRSVRNSFATGVLRRTLPRPSAKAESWSGKLVHEVLWPTDHLDWTNQIFEGWTGTEVELDLVRVHYHFADMHEAVRKHMTQAVSSAIKQWRAPYEVSEIVDWAARRLSTEGMVLEPVDPSWGVLGGRVSDRADVPRARPLCRELRPFAARAPLPGAGAVDRAVGRGHSAGLARAPRGHGSRLLG